MSAGQGPAQTSWSPIPRQHVPGIFAWIAVDYFLDTEAEKNAARAKMKLAAIAVDDEELDSDYEELIGALQDSGNAGTNPSL